MRCLLCRTRTPCATGRGELCAPATDDNFAEREYWAVLSHWAEQMAVQVTQAMPEEWREAGLRFEWH